MYGKYDYFSGHLDPVALQAEIIATGLKLDKEEIDLAITAAYLHDIIEDTSCTAELLIKKGIPNMVVTAVKLLTKGCESNNQYLQTITSSRLATVVKLADSMVNHRACVRDGKFDKSLKYANNINFLSTAMCRISATQ